jgi:hypothetical protein
MLSIGGEGLGNPFEILEVNECSVVVSVRLVSIERIHPTDSLAKREKGTRGCDAITNLQSLEKESPRRPDFSFAFNK